MCVESPARWGYAIAMESEKNCQKCHELYEKYEHIRANYKQMRANFERINANYEQMKAIYEQIHAKYEQVHAKYEQFHAKYEQVHAMYENIVVIHEHKSVQCNTSNCEQHTESKPAQLTGEESTDGLHARMSRLRLETTCSFHASKKRERQPSRVPNRKVFKLFTKRVVRFAAKSYLQKYIPSSSQLKLMLSVRNRYYMSVNG